MGQLSRRQVILAVLSIGVIGCALGFIWLKRLVARKRPAVYGRALRQAVGRGDLGQTEWWLRNGADPNLPAQSSGRLALEVALTSTQINKREITALLLDHGADPNVVLPDGTPLIASAVRHVSPELIALLAEAGTDFNQRDKDGRTVLHGALDRHLRDTAVFAALLEAGADPNLQHKDGTTVLHQVAWEGSGRGSGRMEIVKTLIAHGADPNIGDNRGRTPLAGDVSARLVPLLVEAGSDLAVTDHEGLTPLAWVVQFERMSKTAIAMIDKGADVNVEDKSGSTPLFWAATHGDVALAKALVAKGASVNHANQRSFTPLHNAAGNFHKEMVAYLVAQGAKLDVRNDKGLTPSAYAKTRSDSLTPEKAARKKATSDCPEAPGSR
jgi:ankyrin repeat protein